VGSRHSKQLVWFGNHGSKYAKGGLEELRRIRPNLEEAHRTTPLKLTVVSNSREHYESVLAGAAFPHAYREWDRLHFVNLLRNFDLSLIPASPTAFAISKSNNRLLLALSAGVPVIADPIPDYLPWEGHFLAGDWANLGLQLRQLGSQREVVQGAQNRIKAEYSADAVGKRWITAISEACERHAQRREP
jgi:glycosyltransferase involved in cell wall biosynthesis